MGNPCRYYFENQFVVRRPDVDELARTVKLSTEQSNQFLPHYDSVIIDFYSAPDVILTYSNGNTCKDEWRRYLRWTFTNLRLLEVEPSLLDQDNWATTVFSYDTATRNCDSSMLETDIPLGKFKGMTQEQVEVYKSENRIIWKNTGMG